MYLTDIDCFSYKSKESSRAKLRLEPRRGLSPSKDQVNQT